MKRTQLTRKTPMRAVAMKAGVSCPAVPRAPLRSTRMKASTKRMRQTRSTDTPTAAESARWATMRQVGCIACLLGDLRLGYVRVPRAAGDALAPGALQIHHLTSGGRRLGHDASICLCRYHHMTDCLPMVGMPYREVAVIYGPGFGKGRKPFAAVYGTDAELLEFQNHLVVGLALGIRM